MWDLPSARLPTMGKKIVLKLSISSLRFRQSAQQGDRRLGLQHGFYPRLIKFSPMQLSSVFFLFQKPLSVVAGRWFSAWLFSTGCTGWRDGAFDSPKLCYNFSMAVASQVPQRNLKSTEAEMKPKERRWKWKGHDQLSCVFFQWKEWTMPHARSSSSTQALHRPEWPITLSAQPPHLLQ